jgi:hypothetical protein
MQLIANLFPEKRQHFWVVLLALCAMSALKADTVYDVDLTVGDATVTGFIKTDGTIGTLGDGDITDWNLLLNDTSTSCAYSTQPCTVSLLPPEISAAGGVVLMGTDLSATATQLLFNFGDAGIGGLVFHQSSIGYLAFGTSARDPSCGVAGESLFIDPGGIDTFGAGCRSGLYSGTDFQSASLEGTQAIGTASSTSTPEPSSFSLFAAAGMLLLMIRAAKPR